MASVFFIYTYKPLVLLDTSAYHMLPFRANLCALVDLWEDLGWVAVSGLKMSSLFFSVGQEELAVLRRQLEGKDGEMRRLQDETSYKSTASSGAEPTERGGKDLPSQPLLESMPSAWCRIHLYT